jgi:hypothetical protein
MSDAGDQQAQGGGRFVVWADLCYVAAAFWPGGNVALGERARGSIGSQGASPRL